MSLESTITHECGKSQLVKSAWLSQCGLGFILLPVIRIATRTSGKWTYYESQYPNSTEFRELSDIVARIKAKHPETEMGFVLMTSLDQTPWLCIYRRQEVARVRTA